MPRFFVLLMIFSIACEGADSAESSENAVHAQATDSRVDRSVYPPAPYGIALKSVAENFSFLTADDTQVSFQDLRAETSNRYLLIFGTAAWCTKCEKHMPSIKRFHENYGPHGLVLVAALFEDRAYNRPVARELKAYQRRYDLPIPVLGDGDQQIVSFFGQPNMPMVLLFKLDTMQVEHIGYEWSEDTIDALLMERF